MQLIILKWFTENYKQVDLSIDYGNLSQYFFTWISEELMLSCQDPHVCTPLSVCSSSVIL